MKIALTSDLHRGFTHNTSIKHEKFFRELAEEKFDVLLLAGDLATNKVEQIESLFAHIRRIFPNKPTLFTLGNHDYWGTDKSLEIKLEYIKKYADRHGMHWLHENPYKKDGVTIAGWDNWYAFGPETRLTNDSNWGIKPEEEEVLRKRDEEGFLAALQAIPDVLVTHMPLFELSPYHKYRNGVYSQWTEIVDTLNIRGGHPPSEVVFCYGHTHTWMDAYKNGIKILNCGPDYDKPTYLIVEVNSTKVLENSADRYYMR